MALIIASSTTVRSEIVFTMVTTTSASIIAIIVIIIVSVGGIKLPVVTLVLASLVILLSPSPMLGTSIWFLTTVLAPVGSMTSIVTSVIFVMIIIVNIFIWLFMLRGGEVVETVVVVWIYLYLSFCLYFLYF